ncbi:MAG TPA: hypothetical protein VFI95_21290 [Terriglobales bacterium]|nr:hypothetical protein [Terriglobales bacterium]
MHKHSLASVALFSALLFTVACGGGNLGSGRNQPPGNGDSSSGSSSSQSSAKQQFENSFSAGIAHAAGNYGFTSQNYLVEGAERIQQLGSDSIFIYLTPNFRSKYPDQSSAMWPSTDPAQVSDLIQAAPYAKVLSMPFKTIVLTTYTFVTQDNVAGFATYGNAQAEEDEFYNLATYLFRTYAGTGKTFILKNWEGDWIGLQGTDTTQNISSGMIADMKAWLSARQRGVTRARQDAGNPDSVNVFNAVEVNRVLDYAQNGLTRVINTVVPAVGADMVTYSSYDSTLQGTDPNSMESAMTLALNTIKEFAPDPLGLGDHRILISEYGLYENQLPGQSTWRASTVLSTAKAAGLSGAFMWNIFDNECTESNGQPAPVDTVLGNPSRPTDGECRGLWAVRPDGSLSSVVGVLQGYWSGSK